MELNGAPSPDRAQSDKRTTFATGRSDTCCLQVQSFADFNLAAALRNLLKDLKALICLTLRSVGRFC